MENALLVGNTETLLQLLDADAETYFQLPCSQNIEFLSGVKGIEMKLRGQNGGSFHLNRADGRVVGVGETRDPNYLIAYVKTQGYQPLPMRIRAFVVRKGEEFGVSNVNLLTEDPSISERRWRNSFHDALDCDLKKVLGDDYGKNTEVWKSWEKSIAENREYLKSRAAKSYECRFGKGEKRPCSEERGLSL